MLLKGAWNDLICPMQFPIKKLKEKKGGIRMLLKGRTDWRKLKWSKKCPFHYHNQLPSQGLKKLTSFRENPLIQPIGK